MFQTSPLRFSFCMDQFPGANTRCYTMYPLLILLLNLSNCKHANSLCNFSLKFEIFLSRVRFIVCTSERTVAITDSHLLGKSVIKRSFLWHWFAATPIMRWWALHQLVASQWSCDRCYWSIRVVVLVGKITAKTRFLL